MTVSNTCVIATAVQLNSQGNIEQNITTVAQLIKSSQQHRPAHDHQLIVLPENFACFAQGQQLKTAEQFDAICTQIGQLAAQHHSWIVAGSIPCAYRPNGQSVADNKVRSASVLFDPSGQAVARYDKIHLFEAMVNDSTGHYKESLTFEAGTDVVTASTPFGKIGLMVCFDLRFPKLALTLRDQGATILTAPSAFTHVTGQAHWELLLRARAIDTQSFVIGANQTGYHGETLNGQPPKRQTWGHSAIVEPTGQVLAGLEADVDDVTSMVDVAQCGEVRGRMRLTHF